jgi:hypothetical protein
LKKINQKLRDKIKELNTVVEKAIDKANNKKNLLATKDQMSEKQLIHLMKIRDKEISNSEK